MADIFSKKKRSEIMSRIRSKWSSHEKLAHNYLKSRKVKHKMHPNILGRPDILLKDTNTLLFLDGCFWHKCPKCFKKPKNNKAYWDWKIKYNIEKDRKNRRKLKKMGYVVVSFWEHEFSKKNFNLTKKKILNLSRVGS